MFAINMTPVQWGLSAAAVLMLVYAARTLVSGKGKAQMGLGFALVASVVWTFAIGKQLGNLNNTDCFRLAAGVFLLVPALRVLFSHTGGSVTTGVVSLILASVIAGPVVAPFIDGVDSGVAPEIERMKRQVETADEEIKGLEATRDQVASYAAIERVKLDNFDLGSTAQIEGNADAMAVLQKYAGFKGRLDVLSGDIATLRGQRESLETTLRALERGGDVRDSLKRAEEIRAEVEAEAARRVEDQPLTERYTKRGAALELFEREILKAPKAD